MGPFGCCSRSNTLLKQRCSVAVESHSSLHRRYYFSGSLTRSFSSHVAERGVTGPNIPLHFDSFFPPVFLSVIHAGISVLSRMNLSWIKETIDSVIPREFEVASWSLSTNEINRSSISRCSIECNWELCRNKEDRERI